MRSGAVMLEGLDNLDAITAKWLKDVEEAAMHAAVGLASVALTRILEESPQYSGDFVSGWEVGYSVPPTMWRPYSLGHNVSFLGHEPFQKGDPEAIEYALSKAEPRFGAIASQPLGTAIFLSNSAVHDEPYAWKIELGEIVFRPQNPQADRPVERATFFVENRYKHIGSFELETLRRLWV